MPTTETRRLWAEEDALAAQAAAGRAAARDAYAHRFDAAFRALLDMPPSARATVLTRLECLDGPGCRSGTAAYIDALDWLRRHGVAEANMIFAHDRKHLARLLSAPTQVAAE